MAQAYNAPIASGHKEPSRSGLSGQGGTFSFMSTTQAFNSMAVAFGVATAASYPDLVTFQRPTNTAGTDGGLKTSLANTSPASIPCRYRPATVNEKTISNERVAGALYAIFVPAQYSSSLIDVDAKCDAVIAARSGGEPARTFHTQGIMREAGLEIKVLASIAE